MSRSPSKAPLITPSPSPAIRPPQKKPRLDVDVNEARAASTMRMLDVWGQLADRYSRRLDEDDVIDLNTGQIVKDRGVIKSIPNKWEFGRFADEQSQNEEEEAEDSADELDTLPRTEATVQNEVEEEPEETAAEILQSKVRRVGALDLTNADDAQDLREFLAAEQKRKELCGDDSDEDELATMENTQLATISTQLHTPPASLTPDVYFPLASSPHSRTPSVTKRAPSKVPAKRATSKPNEEPKASQPKSPKKVNKEKTPAPSSSLEKTTVVTRSQSRVPEDPPSNHKKVESAPLSRKGKGKEKAVEPPPEEQITYVSDSGADSDNEFAILDPGPSTSKAGPVTSSSIKAMDEKKTKQREGSKKPAKEESKKPAKEESTKSAKEESKKPAREDSSEPVSKSTRKRKRVASSSETSSPDTSKTRGRRASPSEPSRTATKHKHSKRRSKSKPRTRHSDSASDSESPSPRPHRARSHFSTVPEPYYPYPPPPEHGQPPHYVPLFHPQAQFIISNAMHQLSTLFSSQPYPPPPIPFPLPVHGKHPHPTSSPYHTPRRHAESYYDPAFSHGTLPPSSPEPDSSPTRSREDKPRHSSLVSRSHSRGRRVSFRMQEGADDVEFVDDEKATKSNKKRDDQDSLPVDHPRKEGSSRKVGKAKAKTKALEKVSDSEEEDPVDPPRKEGSSRKVGKAKAKTKALEKVPDSEEEDPSPRRGRSFRRGQTPGPSMRSDSDSPSKRSESRKRR